MNTPHESSDPNRTARFVPRCPVCKYDLRGLPDGRCPECGRAYTHLELWQSHLDKQHRGPGMWLAVTAWVVAVFAHCGGVCVAGDNLAGVVVVSLCAFVVEALLARAAMRAGKAAGLIAAVPPSLHAAVGVVLISIDQSVGLMLVGVCFALIFASYVPRVSDRVGLRLRIGLVLAFGFAFTALFVLTRSDSPWRWWPGGRVMTPGQELALGAALLGAAGVAGWVIRKEWVRSGL